MVRVVRSCLQSILKTVNSVMGMVSIASILYALWLIRAWQRHMGEFPFGDDDDDHPIPWFIYTVLCLGVSLCVITCSAGVTADVFLNRDWEKDFPEDPSGSFTLFKGFIRSNFEICKWIGLSIVSVQGLCFLLALILKAVGPHPCYDSDDDFLPERVPLLKNSAHPPTYVVGDPVYGSRSDAWAIRINDKANR